MTLGRERVHARVPDPVTRIFEPAASPGMSRATMVFPGDEIPLESDRRIAATYGKNRIVCATSTYTSPSIGDVSSSVAPSCHAREARPWPRSWVLAESSDDPFCSAVPLSTMMVSERVVPASAAQYRAGRPAVAVAPNAAVSRVYACPPAPSAVAVREVVYGVAPLKDRIPMVVLARAP